MTGTIATTRWKALDRDGEDKCRLAHLDGGYMLVGHARFRDGSGWAALDYIVRTGPDWITRSADVSGTYGGGEVALRFTVRDGAWAMNCVPQPQLEGCEDIDFAFTPATNLMPMRRLPEVGRLMTRSAWLRLPGPMVTPLSQSYTRERGNLVAYTAEESGYATHLATDPHGFVTHYPGLWEGAGA
ncbi:putative glycolipid-binding domain-containing protein [Salipiger sp.]|uniref:putative glycolipid-binding domain-containing protein n=1 Tax=Salipiger sp. TaxID=2078585 RepID=UPI003A97053C